PPAAAHAVRHDHPQRARRRRVAPRPAPPGAAPLEGPLRLDDPAPARGERARRRARHRYPRLAHPRRVLPLPAARRRGDHRARPRAQRARRRVARPHRRPRGARGARGADRPRTLARTRGVRARARLRANRRARRRLHLLRERLLRRRQHAARPPGAPLRARARAARRTRSRRAHARDAPRARPRFAALARAGREQVAQTREEDMAEPARDRKLTIRPLSASRVEDVKTVTRGTWGAQCWDLFPRFTVAQQRALGIAGKQTREVEARRKAILAKLARRRRSSAGLVAYKDGEPIGWISLGPRFDFARIDASRATPPVDDVAVWVVPCITVRRGHRGS